MRTGRASVGSVPETAEMLESSSERVGVMDVGSALWGSRADGWVLLGVEAVDEELLLLHRIAVDSVRIAVCRLVTAIDRTACNMAIGG